MIFIDTGAFLARYLQKDQYHKKALRGWGRLRESSETVSTSNFVLDETFTLLGRRAGYEFAAERARKIYGSERLTIFRPSYEEEWQALILFEKYADQKVSFTDCTSFVLMKKEKLKRVFTFDMHFQIAGFQIWPE